MKQRDYISPLAAAALCAMAIAVILFAQLIWNAGRDGLIDAVRNW